MNRTLVSLGTALVLMIGLASGAAAQSPLSQVLDLNRQAMEAYQMLELEQAQQQLERALQLAQQRGVTGAPLARTYLNLGVVAVGGFGDNGRGMQYFRQALGVDPNISLDPLTSTPEIQTVFNLARQQGGIGGGGGGGGGSGGGGGAGETTGGGGAAPEPPTGGGGAGGNLPHQAVPEQLAQTAVPVYIEVPGNPAHVYLFYKGHGMREFQRVAMQRVAGGYGFEIPCTDVYQPQVQYYIVAFGGDGSPLGFAGTQSDPVTVPIVGSRTHPAPALPGRAPPQQCGETECPPGMEGCNAQRSGAGMGATCMVDADCGSGLVCRDDLCVAGESGGGGGGDVTHFFIRASLGGAFGYVQEGMTADNNRPDQWDTPLNPGEYDREAWVDRGTPGCPGDPTFEGPCVRVGQAGFVPNFQIRLALGYYIHGLEWLGVAAFARIAPFAGAGDMANIVVGGRLQLRPLVELERQGGDIVPLLTVFAGFSGGQVQHQPPSNGPNAPWIISGLNGVPVGVSGGVRFHKNVAAYAEAELMFQFPTFMFNLDASAGVEVAF